MVDLENWKYYAEHPNETIEEGVSMVSTECFIDETDFAIIKTIQENPINVNELPILIDKDSRTINTHIEKLQDYGIIDFSDNNDNILEFKFDSIKIEF